MNKFKKLLLVGLLITAASCTSQSDATKVANDEKDATALAFSKLLLAQPIPVFNNSQLRQNLIEIETAQANAVVTTSFFFLEGIGLVDQCPSIGFPIPSTDNLSNPQQRIARTDAVVSQGEITGVYTGDSSGTYVVCVDDNGKGYANYYEGYVKVVSGVAHYDEAAHKIVLEGAPTANFSTGDAGK